MPPQSSSSSSTSSRLSILAEAAMREGLVTREVFEEAQRRSQQTGQTVVRTMFEIAAVPEAKRLHFLHRYTGHEVVSLREFAPEREVAAILTREQCRRLRLVPLRIQDGALVVAVEDPTDGRGLQALEAQLGSKIRTVLAPTTEIDQCINRLPEKGGARRERDRSASRLFSLGALAIVPFAIVFYLLFMTEPGGELLSSLALTQLEQKMLVVLGAIGWASVAYFLWDVLFASRETA